VTGLCELRNYEFKLSIKRRFPRGRLGIIKPHHHMMAPFPQTLDEIVA